MQLYKHYKGNRIRASDRSLVVRSFGGRLVCLLLAVVLLLNIHMDLCQYFGQKKLKDYATFFSSSSSFC